MRKLIARASSGVWLAPHHRRPLAECLCCRSDHGTPTPLDPAQPRRESGLRREVYLQRVARGPRGGRRSRGAAPRGHFAGQVVPKAGGSLPLPRPFPVAWFMVAQRANRGRRRKRRFCTARKHWKVANKLCFCRMLKNGPAFAEAASRRQADARPPRRFSPADRAGNPESGVATNKERLLATPVSW